MRTVPTVGILFALALVPAASGDSSVAPKPPTDLTVTSAEETALSVKWDPARARGGRALVGYRVYVEGVRANAASAVDVVAPTTSFTFESLRCGTSYTFAVDAVDDAGTPSEIAAITASTSACTADTTPPTAPGDLAQTGSTETSVTVAWSASTDVVGVAGYSLTVDGSDAGTTTAASHTFDELACGRSYAVTVVAYDTAGNRSGSTSKTATTTACATAAVEPTSTATVAEARTFGAVADARVVEESPTSNYGGSSYLRVDAGSDPDVISYLRFDVTGMTEAVTAAKLRVFATSSTSNGPAVHSTSNDWSERGITWNSRPSPSGAAAADAGRVSSDSWIEWDVTALVNGNGTYSFVLVGESSDGVNMRSRDGGTPPQLVVATGGTSPPPPPPPPPAQCADHVDNDGDGAIDLSDAGCSSSTDNDERNDPPPPPAGCTKSLAADGDLSTFVGSAVSGDVLCLSAGRYQDGESMSLSRSGFTLIGPPGAVVETELLVTGSSVTLRNFTVDLARITDPCPSCGTSGVSGVRVNGANVRIEHLEIRNTARHGIIQHTGAVNTTIVGNYIHDVGTENEHEHGIYFQQDGTVMNNLIVRPKGYGISLYSHPSNVVVAHNTIVGASPLEAAVGVNTDGSNVRVANNIFAFNDGYGLSASRCGSGCMIDRNLIYGNAKGSTRGSGLAVTSTVAADPRFDATYHLLAGSAAVDAGRADYGSTYDRDGEARVGMPDLGADEQ